MPGITVTGLVTAAVKGTRVREVPEIELGELGARGDRAFYIVDERGRMVNAKTFTHLQTVVADYDLRAGTLALTFPTGARATGEVAYGDLVPTSFHSQPRDAREVRGPWSDALSAFFERPLRLVGTGSAVDRGREAGVSVMSRASLDRLAQIAERHEIDGRRFRMLIEVDGVDAHEEDRWIGRSLRVGAALVRPRGHIGRCAVTTRDPDTAVGDLSTLKLLATYRRDLDTTEPLAFGIYGEVVEPGIVRVGDAVALDAG